MAVFVLIHSPLVGPLTWQPVADVLQHDYGLTAAVPILDTPAGPPYWRHHVDAVATALTAAPSEEPPILAAHSGAGPLLPAVRQALDRPVAAYLFVDAGIPRDGASRLDLSSSPQAADRRRASARDGFLPVWTEEMLRDVIPDGNLRRRFVAELRPLPLAVYEEPLPVFDGWPDALPAYLQFSPAYDIPARYAQREGWPSRNLHAGHFYMLVDPSTVAAALVDLARRASIPGPHP